MAAICPICRSAEGRSKADQTGRDVVNVDCPFCGTFGLAGSLNASIESYLGKHRDASSKLSYAIRRAQVASERPVFTTYQADAAIAQDLPSPREQADLLVRWLAENVPGPGELVWIGHANHGAIIGSKSRGGFELVVGHLFQTGLVTGHTSQAVGGRDAANVTLTFAGWDHYETLKRGAQQTYGRAFMAMKFGDPSLDQVLDTVFRPSALRAGFRLTKLNDTPKAGLIDNRLRVEIQASDFVIADLSHDNLGAYWEAGYAEGLGKPVIYTCEKTKFDRTRTHFDTNHHLTICWDASSPGDCSLELIATIRATLPHIALLEDD